MPQATNGARFERKKLIVARPTLGTGGADRVTITLLENLDRTLFDPILVLMRREGALLDRVPKDVSVVELRAGSLWTAWLPLVRILYRQRPDVLFSTSSGMNVAAALAHRVARSRSRLVLSERGLLRREQGLRKRLLARAKKLLYGRASRVTAVSTAVAAELTSEIGVPAEKVVVLRNPVVEDNLSAECSRPVDHPWFFEQTPIVLAAGRLVPEKDFETLLRAIQKVKKRTEVRLFVLGEGPLRAELERLAGSLGLKDSVFFAGYDSNPFRYMSRSALFVLSSISEGLPGALIQAMACGTPVISTDCSSGPREIIDSGESGILVPVADPSGLAQAILRLLNEPVTRGNMGRQAAIAARRFSVAETVPAYQNVLLGMPA